MAAAALSAAITHYFKTFMVFRTLFIILSLLFPLVGRADVVINEVHFNGVDNTVRNEFIELYNTGASSVSLTGWRISSAVDYTFPSGTSIAAGGYLLISESPSTILAKFSKTALGPWVGSLNSDGEKVELRDSTNAVIDSVDYSVGFPWPVSAGGDGASMEKINPLLDGSLGASWRSAGIPADNATTDIASPGAVNLKFATNAPPTIRQVQHTPQQPKSTDAIVITAKVTDPDGVGSVTLSYQVVAPGNYIPRYLSNVPTGNNIATETRTLNPDYELAANWTTVTMNDNGTGGDALAGDGIFTTTIAAKPHRTLLRYRITVTDTLNNSVRVPYADDPAANFACYIYNGVPAYGTTSAATLQTLPVYQLITKGSDWTDCMAYESGKQITQGLLARFYYNWNGTFVYDGVVYDNIVYRTRGGNGRYIGAGKRSMRFKFNRGSYVTVRDQLGNPYPTKWQTITTGKGIENHGSLTYCLNEWANLRLWNAFGVPSPFAHFAHWRNVTTATEQSDDYHGDFQGLIFILEDYDVRYFDAHNMEKGNLYKLLNQSNVALDQQRYQSPYGALNGADHDWIEASLTGATPAATVSANVNLDKWDRYHAICEAVRHYDYWPDANKNMAYYFEPTYTTENGNRGKLWILPFDHDASWGPNWNSGDDVVHSAVFGTAGGAGSPTLWPDYFNAVREVRDLIFQPDQINALLDEGASIIAPFITADYARWKNAPSDVGSYSGINGPGMTSLASLVQDMKNFAFVGGSWAGGTVDAGGRAVYLDNLQGSRGESANIPNTPAVSYIGAVGYPLNDLNFQSSTFSDPQGAGTFGSIQWRIAEITDPTAPAYVVGEPFKLEVSAIYTSPEITPFVATYRFPANVCQSGHTYRVRVRMKDNTGRYSHWSNPVQFTPPPGGVQQDLSRLVVSEINYNPPDLGAVSGDEFEFLELKNTGNATLDLGGLSFTDGISYTFPINTTLAPGGFCVLARDVMLGQTTFHARYPGVTVSGIYTGKLDNSGEKITLTALSVETIFSFTYDDIPPWPTSADGIGNTLVPKATAYNSGSGVNWRASANIFGSPGVEDPAVTTSVVINEILSNSTLPFKDTIELHNPTNASVNVSDWWLTDDPNVPKKYRIPATTNIPAGGYAVFNEDQFNVTTPLPGNINFALNSAGDDVYLFSGDSAGNLTGYSHGFAFAGAEQNVSFGRIVTSAGDEYFPRQISNTFGTVNSGPKVGPLVINEIMYHPYTGYDEFVEIHNISNATVPLYDPANPANTWKIGGLGYTFIIGQSIPAGGYALITSLAPATFRTKYNVPISVQIFGPYIGSLQDNGERISLEMPDTPVVNVVNGQNVTVVPYDVIDTVRYSNLAPWPTAADGTGPSLQRTSSSAYGDDPANWTANGLSGGFPNGTNLLPSVSIAAPATNSPYTAPAIVTFTSNVSDADGSVIKVEYFSGATKLGESSVAPNFSFDWTSTVGTHTITAKATDNSLGFATSAPITVYITTAVTQGLKGDYYGNKTLTAPIAGTRTDSTINFSTASASWPTAFGFPGLTVNTNFSTRWIGQIRATKTGIHKFTTTSNDGIRLYVGGNLVVNSWADTATGAAQVETATAAGTITNSGNATVIVTGAGITGSPLTLSVAVLSGDTPAQWAEKVRTAISGNSAITALYTATRSNADIILTRNIATTHDGTLNISLDNGTCAGIITATTSATTTTGTSTTTSTTSSDVYLNIGQLYDITIEYYQNATDGSVKLEWASSAASSSDSAIFKTTVPQTVLYPDSVPIIVRHPAGMAQTETLNVTAGSGATGNGNLSVTVTSALIPTTVVAVPVTTALNTAALVASAIVTSLNSDPTVSAKFTASNVNAAITLTTKTAYVGPYDSTLNVAIAANTLGVNAVNPSIDGAGVAVTSLTKDQGQSATFTALASGHGLTYQWRKNGQFISGATSQTYTIPYVTPGDAAQYSVFVSNSYGFAISNNAQLTVTYTDSDSDGIQDWWETANGLNPTYTADGGYDNDNDGATNLQEFLAGTNPNDPNSKFIVSIFNYTLTFTAQPYKSYSIQYKNSLTDVNWTTLQSYPANTIQQTINYTDTSHPPNARFYRVTTP